MLAAPWLGHAFSARSLGSSPNAGTEIPQAAWCRPKKVTVKNFLNFVRAALASVQQHQGLCPGLSCTCVYIHTSVQLGVVLLFQWSEPEHGPGLVPRQGLNGNQDTGSRSWGSHGMGAPGKMAHIGGEGRG